MTGQAAGLQHLGGPPPCGASLAAAVDDQAASDIKDAGRRPLAPQHLADARGAVELAALYNH
jgi:hypothetical protein